jgi:hypothetical protein
MRLIQARPPRSPSLQLLDRPCQLRTRCGVDAVAALQEWLGGMLRYPGLPHQLPKTVPSCPDDETGINIDARIASARRLSREYLEPLPDGQIHGYCRCMGSPRLLDCGFCLWQKDGHYAIERQSAQAK